MVGHFASSMCTPTDWRTAPRANQYSKGLRVPTLRAQTPVASQPGATTENWLRCDKAYFKEEANHPRDCRGDLTSARGSLEYMGKCRQEGRRAPPLLSERCSTSAQVGTWQLRGSKHRSPLAGATHLTRKAAHTPHICTIKAAETPAEEHEPLRRPGPARYVCSWRSGRYPSPPSPDASRAR